MDKAPDHDQDSFFAELQRIAAMDPIPAELRKPVAAETFKVPGYTIERALGHLTKSLRPPFPHPPDFSTLAATEEERRSARQNPRCIVHNYLYADVALLSAPGGTGKTTLILWECIHIVLGLSLYDLPITNPGPVLIFTGEDSREILLARLNLIMANMCLTAEQCSKVDNNLLIWDCSGDLSRLVEIDDKGNLTLTGMADEVVEKARPIKPAMIVLDPIISFGPGESRINDGEQMLILAARRMVRGLDCCVRYVTHVSQNNAKSKGLDQYAARGGTALSDGARMVAVLQAWCQEDKSADKPPMTLDRDHGDTVLKLARPKLSYTKPQELLWLSRQGHSFSHATAVKVNEEAELRHIADQVEAFLVSEFKIKKYHSKNSLENSTAMSMPREKLRAAIFDLIASGRISPQPLHRVGRGGKTEYLHPTVMEFPAEESGEPTADQDEKEVA